MVSRLPGEKDGEVTLIKKLIVGHTVFHEHKFYLNVP